MTNSVLRRFSIATLALLVIASTLTQSRALAAEDKDKDDESGPKSRNVIMATGPSLSPDGKQLLFSWDGDIWTVETKGGVAKRLTSHSATDGQPRFSPNGKEIAFVSNRTGAQQAFIMSAEGGNPQQLTYHSEGCSLSDWYPDGQSLLTNSVRDHGWKHAERFFKIDAHKRGPEKILFDDYGTMGQISPDGNRVLYVREGTQFFRQGYVGSQDAQIWLYDIREKKHEKLLNPPGGANLPVWRPDGNGFYFVGCGDSKASNLCEYDFEDKKVKQLTDYSSDVIMQVTLAKDGKTLVFRRLFDLYRFNTGSKATPEKIEITVADDNISPEVDRRSLTNATHVAFTRDALEIAFVSGGDVWVMDTELREPRQVTDTADEERDLVFSNDGSTLYFVSDKGGQTDIWKAERSDSKKYWWNNSKFKLEQITNDPEVESSLKFSNDGSKLAYQRGTNIWTMSPSGSDAKQIIESWSDPEFNWSPDGKWFAYSAFDQDFNSDVWIAPSDGTGKPYNVSRHPDNDSDPTWSPDGKLLAFVGKHSQNEETDVFYVWLRAADDETNRYDRSVQRAMEKMQKGRARIRIDPSKIPGLQPAQPAKPAEQLDADSETEVFTVNPDQDEVLANQATDQQRRNRSNPPSTEPGKSDPAKEPAAPAPAAAPTATPPVTPASIIGALLPKPPVKVQIDFEELHDRVRRIAIQNSTEGNLLFSPDSKRLAFTASVGSNAGTYAVDFPDDVRPKLLAATTGSQGRWLESGNQIAWLSERVPATLSAAGAPTQFRFTARQKLTRASRHVAIFDQAWRIMRDRYYDELLGNKNWNEVRRKYEPAAAAAADMRSLAVIVNLMLGELNGSHLGFQLADLNRDPGQALRPVDPPIATPNPMAAPPVDGRSWADTTAHLGVRFATDDRGPGLLVRDVLPRGSAGRVNSKLEAGDRILAIDGTTVDPDLDLTTILNGRIDRDIELRVKNSKNKERAVTIRPIDFAHARNLVYDLWTRGNQAIVEKESNGKLGYLHIGRMDPKSFQRFEAEVCSVGAGKDGLVIDVRENPGGSITDHLLTILSQPDHAITRPRDGVAGYPQDRIVYATWRKPIIVLCNQNSFSNAEIFSHAIKNLKRGKIVGVPTAGGVISTGATRVMDVGIIRLPFRGWYDPNTGEDMELHGAEPDFVIWPEPGELTSGKDRQLAKAIDVLLDDVKAYHARPVPKLRKAMERDEFKGEK